MANKQTATKAHAAAAAGALAPVLIWLASLYAGAVEAPDAQVVQEALGVLVYSALSGAAAWLGAYFTTNKEKP